MAWRIELDDAARRDLKRLKPQSARRVARLDDPLSIGEPFKGAPSPFWRFCVGDWRVIARSEDEVLRVFVVCIGHRREIYR
jgi:mRNA interferase RelE/StbE